MRRPCVLQSETAATVPTHNGMVEYFSCCECHSVSTVKGVMHVSRIVDRSDDPARYRLPGAGRGSALKNAVRFQLAGLKDIQGSHTKAFIA